MKENLFVTFVEQKSKPFSNKINKTYQLQYVNPIKNKRRKLRVSVFVCLSVTGDQKICVYLLNIYRVP